MAVRESSDDRALQHAIRSALDASRTNIPHLRVWKGILDPLLSLAGVKSWTALSRRATCIEVEEEGPRIVLVPTKNLGQREGFEADISKKIAVDAASDELVATVRRLLMAPA